MNSSDLNFYEHFEADNTTGHSTDWEGVKCSSVNGAGSFDATWTSSIHWWRMLHAFESSEKLADVWVEIIMSYNLCGI